MYLLGDISHVCFVVASVLFISASPLCSCKNVNCGELRTVNRTKIYAFVLIKKKSSESLSCAELCSFLSKAHELLSDLCCFHTIILLSSLFHWRKFSLVCWANISLGSFFSVVFFVLMEKSRAISTRVLSKSLHRSFWAFVFKWLERKPFSKCGTNAYWDCNRHIMLCGTCGVIQRHQWINWSKLCWFGVNPSIAHGIDLWWCKFVLSQQSINVLEVAKSELNSTQPFFDW